MWPKLVDHYIWSKSTIEAGLIVAGGLPLRRGSGSSSPKIEKTSEPEVFFTNKSEPIPDPEVSSLKGPHVIFNGKEIEPTYINRDLFHGQKMSMEEIIKAGGLPEKGNNINYLEHLNGNENTALRGANLWLNDPLKQGNGPVGWAGEGGTVVRIDGSKVPVYDSNALTRDSVKRFDGKFGDHKWAGEGEFSFHARTPLESIKQFGKVTINPRTGAEQVKTWVDNPFYKK